MSCLQKNFSNEEGEKTLVGAGIRTHYLDLPTHYHLAGAILFLTLISLLSGPGCGWQPTTQT